MTYPSQAKNLPTRTFVMYTMLPWFKRWEENINMQLLTSLERKAGFYIKFNINSLLRGDMQSRVMAYAQGRQWGWHSVNDIRKLENMLPIPNGDMRKLADDMDKIDESILTTYQAKTGLEAETIIEMVNAKTWLTTPIHPEEN